VDVCLNKAVNEPKSGAYFPAASRHLRRAGAFLRSAALRPATALDRIVRQQVFLGALASKVLSADHADQPVRRPAI